MKNFSRACTALFWALIGLGQLSDLNFIGALPISVAGAQDSSFESKKIVPFVPSPQEVVD